jgi:hypothetical protein
MTSTFDSQLAPCARNGHSVRPPPVAPGASSPPARRAIRDKPAPDRMLDHKTQAAFLKALIAYEDNEASRQLQDSLSKADRERKCIRHALFITMTLFIIAVAGLSYCALLLPRIFSNPTHFVTRSLNVLGLASLICQVEFFSYLLWHRFAVNRLHKECRRRVLLLVDSQLSASLGRSSGVVISQEPESIFASVPVQQTAGPSPEPA